MKVNKKMLIFIGIVFLSISIPLLTYAQTEPNDYIAFVFEVSDFKPVGEDGLRVYYPVGYIPVTGSSTYTYTRANLVTEINMSNPSTINSRMRATILEFAISKGYNVKRIIYQDYNVAKI